MAASRTAPVTDFEVGHYKMQTADQLQIFPLFGQSVISITRIMTARTRGKTFCQEGKSKDDEDVEMDESLWIEELTTRNDFEFNQAVGMAEDPASLKLKQRLF